MGLLVLDQRQPQIARIIGQEAGRAFDLAQRGSLGAWLASVTFGFAVAIMLGTYSVRRYRRDDYRGKFTVWRWAIVAAVMISVDSTCHLHDAWQGACEFAFQTKLWGDGSIWWLGCWSLVLGGMLVRLMMEMSSSRLATVAAAGAGLCYLYSLLAQLNVHSAGPLQASHISKVAILLLGHHLMLYSLVSYARDVVLEAMGLLESPIVRREKAQQAKAERSAKPAQSTKKKAPAASKTPKPAEKPKRDEQPKLRAVSPDEDEGEASSSGRKSARSKTKPKLKAVHPPEEVDHTDEEPRKLSKSERRRLRKEQRKRKAA